MSSSADDAIDTGIHLADTVLAVVKEVGEVLDSVPYVKSLSSVVLKIIQIRDEIKLNEKRCRELVDKVLRMSRTIFECLSKVGRSKERAKLSELKDYLTDCQGTLSDVLTTLEQHKLRGRFTKFINRGLDDLNALDRRVDELILTFHTQALVSIRVAQEESVPYADELRAPNDPSINHEPDHIIIPAKPKLMVGRQTQVDSALKILLSAEPSRIAILGGGGFGKTTFARTILHDPKIVEHYKSRYFLSCESMDGPDNLLIQFGQLLGISVVPSAVLASARRMLETSTTLLCLDNFETPWEPFNTRGKVEEVLEAIADIPNLSLIITIRGEQRPSKVAWSTPLLSPLSTLSLDGAKSILQTIAENHTADNYTLQLLDATDGIPLAITLISTLIRDGESSESLWKRWETNHTQIVGTGGDDRQSNLNRSIELSVSSPRVKKDAEGSQLLLAFLSLLPDGLPADADSLESWQKILNSDDSVLVQVRQALARLAASRTHTKQSKIIDIHAIVQSLRSVALIKVDETGTSPRVRMLSPIRLFCHQRFSKETSLVLKKTVDYYMQLLADAKFDLTNSEYSRQIIPQIKNIHSIFRQAFAAGDSLDLDYLKLIEVTKYLARWSTYTGYYAKEAIQMALSKSASYTLNPVAGAFRIDCLIALGNLYRLDDELEQAESCFREAVKLARGTYDLKGGALTGLGVLFLDMAQYEQAEDTFKASLKIYSRASNKRGQADSHYWLGKVYLDKGQYSEAEEIFTKALEEFKKIQHLTGQADTTLCLARVHVKLGNLIKAEYFVDQSLTISRQANHTTGEACALWNQGRIYLLNDKLTDACQAIEQAVTIYRKQNSINKIAAINDLAWAYIQSDRLSTAEALLTTYDKADMHGIDIAHTSVTLGWLYICGDRLDKAEDNLCKALQFYEKSSDSIFKATIAAHLATIHLKLDRLDDAERVIKSIPVYENCGEVEMCRLWVLGDFYVVKGQFDDAETSFNSAMSWAKSRPSSYQQGNIFRSIGTLNVKRGRIDLAIENFSKALEYHRKAQWVYEQASDIKLIGEAYKTLGRFEEADVKFEEAEALMDTVREIRTLL